MEEAHHSLEQGRDVIRRTLAELPQTPGVYRMLDKDGKALYVGKAKHLKNRVANYVNAGALNTRLQRMVSLTTSMEIITTRSEAEALLLEANLIKKHMPRYNILLRDDKSFPYIMLSGDHPFPRIAKHRGSTAAKGKYFGPFVSAGAVDETIVFLQKAFLLRPCSDNIFKNRTRPCLQYQIKRCSAPCVRKISEADYAKLVTQAEYFLKGKSQEVQQELVAQMQELSLNMLFEKASVIRDRIKALNQIQQGQAVSGQGLGDADVIALARDAAMACIQLFSFRSGRNYGSKCFFPQHTMDSSDSDILTHFIGQFYQKQPVPPLLLISHLLDETTLMEEALRLHAQHKIDIVMPLKGSKREVVEQALRNAQEALARHLAVNVSQREVVKKLRDVMSMEEAPDRIEIYDNSHISGTDAVGAMVVAARDGFVKNAYRTFNIKNEELTPGDDYAMMREVLTRRFNRLQTEEGDANRPDLVLIDGGAEHLKVAERVFEELGVQGITLAAIAKGADRNAGREWFHLPNKAPFQLPVDDPVLHYLQRLRDEAHRFAIGTHRNKRSKTMQVSTLDEIPAVGAVRKKALLAHFGSVRGLSGASIDDIAKVPGISKTLAKMIYDYFHS
ncbi:MAG: excinuclease ABC subunit UvrC [Alphaproteobacteria bacterium]|nr:excinuclease ABC subunit UvrC [Alphaproteobacteria bacterium]